MSKTFKTYNCLTLIWNYFVIESPKLSFYAFNPSNQIINNLFYVLLVVQRMDEPGLITLTVYK